MDPSSNAKIDEKMDVGVDVGVDVDRLTDVVLNLKTIGLDTSSIALATGLPIATVRTISKNTYLSPTENDLSAEIRGLMHIALVKAHRILKFGSPADQLTIIRTLVSSSTKLLGEDPTNSRDDVRADFSELMAQMRKGAPELETIVTDSRILEKVVNAPTDAVT